METVKTLMRFSSRNENGCIEWTGGKFKTGYGKLRNSDGKTAYAHRESYALKFGKIPNGMFVCHKCDNRKCINPDHLFLGTAKDNFVDMVNKGRRVINPLRNEHHGMCKHKSETVAACRALYSTLKNAAEIARIMNIPHRTVHKWVTFEERVAV